MSIRAGARAQAHELTEVVTRLRRTLRASIRTDISWESLPMAQVEIMQSLAEASPARVSDLADRLHLANSTVSGLISQLITAELVERGTDATDRRAAVVTLSDKGFVQLEHWEQAHERRIGKALEAMDGTERDAIQGALSALAHLAELLGDPQD